MASWEEQACVTLGQPLIPGLSLLICNLKGTLASCWEHFHVQVQKDSAQRLLNRGEPCSRFLTAVGIQGKIGQRTAWGQGRQCPASIHPYSPSYPVTSWGQ